MKHKQSIRRALVTGVIVSLTLCVGAGTALAAIQVEGNFDASLGGYGDETNVDQRPNEIVVDGEFTVKGEDAQNVRIIIHSGQWTVLETDSVSVFVEGDAPVTFTEQVSPGTIKLTTDQIPAGTTVQLSFSTYFTGGTTNEKIDAGTVTVKYESLGGTANQKSFSVNTSMETSPDNKIKEFQNEQERSENTRLLTQGVAVVGGFAILAWAAFLIYRWRNDTKPY